MHGLARWTAVAMAMAGPMGGSGCTAANPAYDEPRSSGTGDSGATIGAATEVDTAVDDTGTTGEVCTLHPERPIKLDVLFDGLPRSPSCAAGSEVLWLATGPNLLTPAEQIIHLECQTDTCDCTGTEITIDLQGSVPLPPLPDCGQIAVWARQGDDGCGWDGVVMFAGSLPVFIASNSLQPAPLAPITLGLVPQMACGDAQGTCDVDDPGRYAIELLGHELTVEDTPATIPIAFSGATLDYEVNNRMSSINRDCRPRVAWTAWTMPPG